MEGTLAEKDSVYRAKEAWRRIDTDTDAMHVPNGMVIRTTYNNKVALVFVPCDNYDRRDWINSWT